MRYQVMHHSEVYSMLDYDIPKSAKVHCLEGIEIC